MEEPGLNTIEDMGSIIRWRARIYRKFLAGVGTYTKEQSSSKLLRTDSKLKIYLSDLRLCITDHPCAMKHVVYTAA